MADMRCLVVFAHPAPTSFGHALKDATVDGLHRGGHEVTVIDLYADGFDPCLSADELDAYETIGADHPTLGHHIEHLRRAEALVFVYPTWWSGLPAILKGWIDRTMLPGVAFTLHPRSRRLVPALPEVRHLVGVTTYGSPRWLMLLVGDGGRRTIQRTVRVLCRRRRVRRHWLAMHQLDGSSDEARRDFLAAVTARTATLT